MKQKAVFLDRDGVINIDHGYVHTVDTFDFVPGTLEACAQLHQAGYALVVVTNQSGIARGYYDEAQFQRLSQWMCDQFAAVGAVITQVYFCPHHPSKGNAPYVGDCQCRKPQPGMLVMAAQQHQLDLSQSIMIGDKAGDMEAGQQAGVKHTLLVRSGKQVDAAGEALADAVLDNVAAAAQWILTPQ
ncbi:D-glycero-beta-D-manno-heptose 1,7-bisphosphate 7-phosphatase [uncultured Ferrimonas sp.]|uniref:D-glycero-beta-D-manno-heptose 1,7-bisphosphate 7-phosphatase n=1 Tax=uncultured Ferrimonas sp. TaxID=432640 RepID=UPI00261F083F|nr:D-glycero-beta-D-manno-heptose 1,7-bisphosphate 7-phosphatase [uncultured Ferrimonas sp.]